MVRTGKLMCGGIAVVATDQHTRSTSSTNKSEKEIVE